MALELKVTADATTVFVNKVFSDKNRILIKKLYQTSVEEI